MNTKTKHWASITAGILSLAGYASATSFGSERYTYDASGNIVERQIGAEVTQFDYEGNILKGSSGNTDPKHYQYDDAGRLTGEMADGQVVRRLGYQFSDKMTKVQSGEKTTEFFYNAEGYLVGKTNAKGIEALAWDGLGIVLSGSQSYTSEGHQTGGVPAMRNGEVVVSDYLGTTLRVGVADLEASAFGEGLEGGFFTGKPFIEELDSFVFKYRNYSPNHLRWTSLDPAGYPDGANNRVYLSGDPLNMVDPLGLAGTNAQGNPEDDELFPENPWSKYNDFWEAAPDTSWASLAPFQSGGYNVQVRRKFEYYRDSVRKTLSIPQDSEIDVDVNGVFSYTVSGGISVYSIINFGASGTWTETVGISRNFKAHKKGTPQAYNYVSQTNLHKEVIYQTVEQRIQKPDGSWGSWSYFSGTPFPGSVTSGDIGFSDNMLGILEYKEN